MITTIITKNVSHTETMHNNLINIQKNNMAENVTNPNGANDTTSDPREQVMWDIYVTNLAKGIDNAYKAAIEAGYEEATSKQITVRRWFIERKEELERKDMLSDAEKVLRKTLRYNVEKTNKETGETEIKTDLLRIQTDVAKTVATTLGKDKGYSTRIENTGKNGQDLINTVLVKFLNAKDESTDNN